MIDSAAESPVERMLVRCPISDLMKITDQLDEQVICVGQVRLLGTSAAEKVERVDGVGAAELFADGFPLIAARCKVQIVNQQKRFAGTAFCIVDISQPPFVAERILFPGQTAGGGSKN